MSNTTWTNQHEQKKTMLYNYLFDKNQLIKSFSNDSFIIDMKEKLYDIIKDSKWADSTKKGLLFMISRYLNIHTPTDILYIKKYSQHGYELNIKIDNETKENKHDEKEEVNYKPKEYFLNILNNLNFSKEEKQLYGTHLKQLLLSFVILQPPMRTSYYTSSIFINNLKDDNQKDNYIYIDNDNQKAFMIVNTDKVSQHKLYKDHKEHAIIPIMNPKLSDYIIQSYKDHPRTYLFENLQTKQPYSDNALLNRLREITRLPTINFQMMRSNYITWEHTINKSYKEKEKLAKQMRHSVATASINYFKDLENIKEIQKDKEDVVVDTANNNLILNFNKAKKDNLYKYNVKKAKPTEKTLKKFDIKYNEESKLYY